MVKEKLKNYTFKNSVLSFETYINEFTSKMFHEFDAKAQNINLSLKIDDLINGRIVNFSENQAAWHPKYRMQGPKQNDHLHKLIKKIKKSHNLQKVNLVVIGIGGSFEGPKLLIESLNSPVTNNEHNFQFLTGSDPVEFKYKTSLLDPYETIFIISSKSFSTDETIEMLKMALDWSPGIDHFVAITANPNEAKKYGFDNNIVSFDKEIGGRYSIWSPIAELPLIEELPYELFLKGGHQADKDILEDEDYIKFIKRLSFSDIWNNNIKDKNIRAVLSYIWSFRSLSDYIQQLEMESLGKQPNQESEYKKTGQVIFGGYGPTAQHSYFQLLHQGTQSLCADIITSKEDPNNLAYAQSITQSKLLSDGANDLKQEERINGNVSVNLFILNKADPYTLGYLIALWEHRTFISASMLGINPFDQFGVIAGKIYTKRYIDNID
tara:strand:- start:12350 stop:13660 length:1311 start_codon:yes stop_codon:yes gene_type:complete